MMAVQISSLRSTTPHLAMVHEIITIHTSAEAHTGHSASTLDADGDARGERIKREMQEPAVALKGAILLLW
jgi:hypothetical protein